MWGIGLLRIRQSIVLNQIGSHKGLDVIPTRFHADQTAGEIPVTWVESALICDKLHAYGIGIVNGLWYRRRLGRLIIHRQHIQLRVDHFVQIPNSDNSSKLVMRPCIRRIPIFHRQPSLGLDDKTQWRGTQRADSSDLAETFPFGPVLGSGCAITDLARNRISCAVNQNQPLPIQAKPIIGVQVHTAPHAIGGHGFGAACD